MTPMSPLRLTLLLPAACLLLEAQSRLAPTPPMGWNSWDAYGTTVTENEVKANADYMAEKLKRHGWQYIVVDIQWSEANPKSHGYRDNADLVTDANGRLLPAPNRFPSAGNGNGFKPLAGYVHARGLKFGIHIMRGIPRRAVDRNLPVFGSKATAASIADKNSTCRWNKDMYGVDLSKEGGQAYYDSIVKLYASWGVDYIKADDMATPFHDTEMAALHNAIVNSGRPIVLSLSPGPADVSKAAFYAANANLWRIANDFWDKWDDLKANFALMAKWAPYSRPGAWPDADMLPLGRIGLRAERGDDRHTRFTADESQTLMTLWSIAQSPLMFGGDLPSNDPATLALITNDDVLRVNQSSTASRQVQAMGDTVVWTSDDTRGGSKNIALFNVSDKESITVRAAWSELGISKPRKVRDLWTGREQPAPADRIGVFLRPHASALLRVQ